MRASTLGVLVLLAMASPAQAQLEPEAYTILKEALKENPPNAAHIVSALKSCKNDTDRQKLADVWLQAWAAKPQVELFDAFDGCFATDDAKVKESAQTFIKAWRPTESKKEIARSAAAFLDRLRALPAAERTQLQEFGKLARSRIRRASAEATATLTGYKHYNVAALAFSADSKTLAIGTTQGVQLWDVAKNQERALLKPSTPQENWRGLAFSPDGKLLAGGGQGALVLWNLEKNEYVTHFASTGAALAWTRDGKFIVDAGGRAYLRLWEVEKRRLRVEHASNQYYCDSVAIASNGKDLVLGTSGGCVFVKEPFVVDQPWQRDTPALPLPKPHWRTEIGMTSAVSPGCQRFASSDKEGTLTLGGLETTETQKFVKAHKTWAFALAFSADGLTLASGSADKTVKLWDAISGAPLATLTGHTDRISGLAFSPDGKTLASGSYDRTVKLWDVSKVVIKKPKKE